MTFIKFYGIYRFSNWRFQSKTGIIIKLCHSEVVGFFAVQVWIASILRDDDQTSLRPSMKWMQIRWESYYQGYVRKFPKPMTNQSNITIACFWSVVLHTWERGQRGKKSTEIVENMRSLSTIIIVADYLHSDGLSSSTLVREVAKAVVWFRCWRGSISWECWFWFIWNSVQTK